MFTIYIVGLLLTAALFMWYLFDFYGGYKNFFIGLKANPEYANLNPKFVIGVATIAALILSAFGWPLLLLVMSYNLYDRYKKTGSIHVLFPHSL